MPPKMDAKEKKATVPKKATTTKRAARVSTRGGRGRSGGSAAQTAVRGDEESAIFEDNDGVMQDYSELLKYSGTNRPQPGSNPLQFPPTVDSTTITTQTFAAQQEFNDIPMLDVPGSVVNEFKVERLLPWKGPVRKDKTAAEWLAQVQQKIRLQNEKLKENKDELDKLTSMGEEYQDEAQRLAMEQESFNLELMDLTLQLNRAYRGYKGPADSYWDTDS